MPLFSPQDAKTPSSLASWYWHVNYCQSNSYKPPGTQDARIQRHPPLVSWLSVQGQKRFGGCFLAPFPCFPFPKTGGGNSSLFPPCLNRWNICSPLFLRKQRV